MTGDDHNSEGETGPALGVDNPEQLLQQVMDSIPQFIFWKDRNSVYLGGNEKFARAAGVDSPADLIGKDDRDLVWKPEETEWFRTVDRRVMESGKPERNIVEPQLQADGRQAWLRTNKVPIFGNDGEVVGIVGTFEDITDERVAEQRNRHAQKMEAIGRLAGGMAHDFNNMLGGILGAADLLRADVGEGRGPELLEIILHSAQRAADLTHKMLAFSRRGQMQRTSTDLHTTIGDAASILGRSIDRRIAIELDLAAKRSVVLGDHAELEAAILNLGINARDAIDGAGRIDISTSDVTIEGAGCYQGSFVLAAGEYIELRVRDTGPGVPEAIRERIFEPFFTTKSVGAGTGLGLAAVFGAVSEHGGAVALVGGSGGACFRLLLPITDRPAAVDARRRSPPTEVLGRPRILVVDDEPAIRDIVCLTLDGLGYQTVRARNGVEALEIFAVRPQSFDAVILDVVMPEMGGHDCLRELQRIDPSVRVLMSSGFADDVMIEESDEAVYAFLKKPYHPGELSRTLARVLGKE